MMPKRDSYTILGWVAMVSVPFAPALFFGWSVYRDAMGETAGVKWLSILAAFTAALGLELIGILAGHNTIEFWKRGDNGRAIVAGVIMLVYTVIGMWQLRDTAGAIMFVIAPMAYILVAMRHNLNEEKKEEKGAAVYQLRVEAQEREHRQRLEAAQLRLKHEERMETIKAKAAVSGRVSQETKMETEETARQRMERHWKPGMKPTQLAELAHVSKGYASKYINNGAMKHYQLGGNQ